MRALLVAVLLLFNATAARSDVLLVHGSLNGTLSFGADDMFDAASFRVYESFDNIVWQQRRGNEYDLEIQTSSLNTRCLFGGGTDCYDAMFLTVIASPLGLEEGGATVMASVYLEDCPCGFDLSGVIDPRRVAAVPENESWLLFIIGFAGIGLLGARKKIAWA